MSGVCTHFSIQNKLCVVLSAQTANCFCSCSSCLQIYRSTVYHLQHHLLGPLSTTFSHFRTNTPSSIATPHFQHNLPSAMPRFTFIMPVPHGFGRKILHRINHRSTRALFQQRRNQGQIWARRAHDGERIVQPQQPHLGQRPHC